MCRLHIYQAQSLFGIFKMYFLFKNIICLSLLSPHNAAVFFSSLCTQRSDALILPGMVVFYEHILYVQYTVTGNCTFILYCTAVITVL